MSTVIQKNAKMHFLMSNIIRLVRVLGILEVKTIDNSNLKVLKISMICYSKFSLITLDL
jgi:hypothetical protein